MQPRFLMRFIVPAVVVIFAFVAPLELALRLVPSAIPLNLLIEFEPTLRSAIAKQRKLQRFEDTVLVPRDDGGPADRMWIYKPGVEVTEPFEEAGIVDTRRMDDAGFCNADAAAYEKLERLDVAAIGDSFTFCIAVVPADAWPAVLAERTGLRVYNFGMPGRGLYEYVQTLKAFALAKRPHFVVVAVYEGNDLRDAVRFHEGGDSATPKAQHPCPFASDRLCAWHERLKHGFLGRHSYVFNLALSGIWRFAYNRDKKEIDFRYDIRFPDGNTVTFNSRNGDLDEVTYARWLVRDEVSVDLFERPLRDLVALGREHGFTPIVVYIPSAYTAYRHRAHFHDAGVERTVTEFSDRQRGYFARKAGEAGFVYRDLTSALQRAAAELPSTRPLYFRTNVHLTPAGHAVVAAEVAEEIPRESSQK
jgi:SGNH hydrolase-like domain, acetyltransferase AlgX